MWYSELVFQIAYQRGAASKIWNVGHPAFNEEEGIPHAVPRGSMEKFEIFKCYVFTCD